jgi:uncharacterized protein YegP (UPF0339 family)
MKFVLYKDRDGEWRWSLRAKNGRIVAASAEGYNSKRHAINMCRKINSDFQRISADEKGSHAS